MLKKSLIGLAVTALFPIAVLADTAPEAESFKDALIGGTFSGNFKFRYENVNQDGFSETGEAWTLRSLLGYETKAFHGFSVNAQVYGVSPLNDDYNDIKKADSITSRRQYPTIADPEDYDFHQLYLQWKNAENTVKLGRQAMVLDNWRFVGDVRFRQNWQVFNGLSFVNTSLPKTTVTLAHYEQVKQITTKIEDADIDIAHAKYQLTPGTSVVGYGYFVDWNGRTQQANSTKTYGVRVDGTEKLDDHWKVLFTAEYAKQDDYKDGSDLIDNHYYRFGAGAGYDSWFIRLDQELLSGNKDGKAFQTPLGTNHLFQGWTDLFLATPNVGIEDTMLIAGGKFMGATIKTEYHWINSDRNFAKAGGGTGNNFGTEWDVGVYYNFTKQISGSVEYANFKEDEVLAAGRKRDTEKLWVTAGYTF